MVGTAADRLETTQPATTEPPCLAPATALELTVHVAVLPLAKGNTGQASGQSALCCRAGAMSVTVRKPMCEAPVAASIGCRALGR